jgi:hypothetical protein
MQTRHAEVTRKSELVEAFHSKPSREG